MKLLTILLTFISFIGYAQSTEAIKYNLTNHTFDDNSIKLKLKINISDEYHLVFNSDSSTSNTTVTSKPFNGVTKIELSSPKGTYSKKKEVINKTIEKQYQHEVEIDITINTDNSITKEFEIEFNGTISKEKGAICYCYCEKLKIHINDKNEVLYERIETPMNNK